MKEFFKSFLGEKRKKWLFALIMTAAALIWINSMLPVSESSAESGWFTEHIIDPILGIFGLSAKNGFVRKLAHVTEYAVLSLLMAGIFDGKLRSVRVCFFIAFIDETIQIFSKRGPKIQDVWIDMIGVAAGYLLIKLIEFLKRKRAKNALSDNTGGPK